MASPDPLGGVVSVDFENVLRSARRRLLKMHYESQVCHLGGNLSCLDALVTLQHRTLTKDDVFILSKGHSAGALYVALWSAGKLSEDDLKTFHQDGTRLAGHPASGWHPDIRFSTGSLGHGPGLAAGTALSRKLSGRSGRIFCLTSDGEWQEGSCWEALTFAAHRGLDNLCLLVDQNGLQGFGSTEEVASTADLEPRFRAFHAGVRTVDGHDPDALLAALDGSWEAPRIVVLRTVKGRFLPGLEGRMESHYLPLKADGYEAAVKACGEGL